MQSLEELVLGADRSCFDVKRCRGLLALDAGRGGEFLLRTADQHYYVHAAPDWHTTSDFSKPCPTPDLEGAHVYMDLENRSVFAVSIVPLVMRLPVMHCCYDGGVVSRGDDSPGPVPRFPRFTAGSWQRHRNAAPS